MGEPELIWTLASEPLLLERAGAAARSLRRAEITPLIIGLSGELGAGKTTWVRGMLRGLGYAGRVPSPTYTLVEHYRVADLDVVHVDLYRLAAPEEVEALGMRDWLSLPRSWLLIEWPERSSTLAARCDLGVSLEWRAAMERRVAVIGRTSQGAAAVEAIRSGI